MSAPRILWKRLDAPGHDAASLRQAPCGWAIEGAAAFSQAGEATWLAYSAFYDSNWHSIRGLVRGACGSTIVDVTIERRNQGTWVYNGVTVPGLEDCLDLDFGFTPATNLSQVRRLALSCGGSAEARVAWFDLTIQGLKPLLQRCERRSETAYWYESPEFGYSGLLEFGSSGFCQNYPGLWRVELEFQ